MLGRAMENCLIRKKRNACAHGDKHGNF